MPDFGEFASIPRLSREMVVTEKLDGRNAQVAIWLRAELEGENSIGEATREFVREGLIVKDGIEYVLAAGSRNQWLAPGRDNFGFATWVRAHAEELLALGPGRHYGEWWGLGIQRGYALKEKRFSLFNTKRWSSEYNNVWYPNRPEIGVVHGSTRCIEVPCCYVTPVLYGGMFDTAKVDETLGRLREHGSEAAPGFNNPEGVIVYHVQGNLMFKKTLDKNDGHKGTR